MSCIRPATPGFIVTSIATILLAIVALCVPINKSVFFLRASITEGGFNGSIVFGTLGYCLELSNGTTCSKPSVGYELDINSLVGNKLPVEIPQIVVKWITYVLVLHIVALVAAAGSAGFGLLAHCREMSMTCCSTCFSGLAAAIAFLAFIFDFVIFFVAKARINSIGSAQIGSAIWLTLVASILLFLSQCFYNLGKCCISNRPSRGNWTGDNERRVRDGEQRLQVVEAEEGPKEPQKSEGGLPSCDARSFLPKTPHSIQDHTGYRPQRRFYDYGNTYPPQPPHSSQLQPFSWDFDGDPSGLSDHTEYRPQPDDRQFYRNTTYPPPHSSQLQLFSWDSSKPFPYFDPQDSQLHPESPYLSYHLGPSRPEGPLSPDSPLSYPQGPYYANSHEQSPNPLLQRHSADSTR